MSSINPQKALEDIARSAPAYAKAKAERIYVEEYRKVLKAQLMQQAEAEGHKTAAAQEREAYAHSTYGVHLEALRDAIEAEETLRWRMVAAETAVDVWRSIEASNRRMDRAAA